MQEANGNVLQQRLRSQQIVIEYMKCQGKSAEETENESLQQFHFYFVMLLKYLFVKTDEPIDLVDLNFFIVHFIGPLNSVIGSNIALL